MASNTACPLVCCPGDFVSMENGCFEHPPLRTSGTRLRRGPLVVHLMADVFRNREPSAALERPRARVLPVCCLHTDGQLFSAGSVWVPACKRGCALQEAARKCATRKAPAGRGAAGLLITVALSCGLAHRTSPLARWRPPLQGEAYASGVSSSGVSPLACRSFSNLPAQFFRGFEGFEGV